MAATDTKVEFAPIRVARCNLIPRLLAGVGGNPQLMQRDGLHLHAEDTRIVEATVRKTLEPLLKKGA
ncbi:MAG: hypothetical protein LAQ69_12695 [Acidobacteriia bacterium]|nr:hypothetical protein [Terriglobia bacterium]